MIYELLKAGKENAIDSDTLMKLGNFQSKRAMTKEIERERQEGRLILSAGNGYFLPKNRQEIQSFVDSMERRAKSVFFVLHAAREALKQIDGQLEMDHTDSVDTS